MSRRATINKGDVFGRLTVVEYANIQHRTRYYKCVCVCGNVVTIRGVSLTIGATTSCGCYARELSRQKLLNNNYTRLEDGVSQRNQVILTYKINAKRRNLLYNLTIEEFEQLTLSNCHYCGNKPSSIRKDKRSDSIFYIYNGIDRIDNTKGYIVENVVTCCKICNYAKGTMSYNDFIAYLERIKVFRNDNT